MDHDAIDSRSQTPEVVLQADPAPAESPSSRPSLSEEGAVTKLQALWRGYASRRDLEEQEPTRPIRATFKSKRHAPKPIPEGPTEDEEESQDASKPITTPATTVIRVTSAAEKGDLAPGDQIEEKRAGVEDGGGDEEGDLEKEREKENEAAFVLQAAWRKGRKAVPAKKGREDEEGRQEGRVEKYAKEAGDGVGAIAAKVFDGDEGGSLTRVEDNNADTITNEPDGVQERTEVLVGENPSGVELEPSPPAAMEGGGGDGESAFDTWFNKLYLGGYRVRETQREFYHATTQTITPQEIRAMKALPKYHRDTQTKDLRNRMAQGKAHTMTQMDKPGVYVAQDYDYILQPRRYVSAEERYRMIVQKVVKIQSFVRKCYAIRKVRQMRKERDYRLAMLAEKERRRKELADKRRKKEIESRLHPKTIKDFEVLYNGLEHWRQQQSEKINMAGYSEPARLTALADLLDQEAALIQKIDRLKIVANEENRERSIIRSLDMMAAPKKWPVSKPPGSFTLVDTPNTIRARELRDLYHALNIAMLTVDERLQILLHVKYTVKEFDCNLTREIVELIDREGDLVSRGRDPQSLEGLRKRISTLFLQFIRTPEFNPESSMYQRFPDSNQAWKRDQSVYYCRGCTKYLPSTRFYLSTTIRQLGNCKSCTQKENIAHQRKDDSFYAEMLKLVRIQEHQKRSKLTASEDSSGSGSGNGSDGSGAFAAFRRGDFHDNAFALLQESDMRYLVDVIWNRQSAISAAKRVEELILTRWDPVVELSPWNCVLLTKAEAATHDRVVGETIVAMAKAAAKLNVVAAMRSGSRSVSQGNEALHKLYSEEFVNKVHQKHILARQHFAQLPTMERYLKRNYGDGRRDGKIDLKMAVGVV